MKILYGVQGTGNGHITRARILCEAFNRRSHIKVDYLFTGRPKAKYFDMETFGDYQTKRGLTFITQKGRINRLQTLKNANIWKAILDINALDLSGYDLVLNDFEPISAWASKLQNVPSLSISHQAALEHPKTMEDADLIDRLIMKFFAPTRYSLGVHWHHFNKNIIPPFVETGVQPYTDKTPNKEYTLVYLPFESIDDINSVFSILSEYRFTCFHPDVSYPHKISNIEWYPTGKETFQAALKQAANVIGNGGFELATECISLGKQLLIKPLDGQFEQLSNAKTLSEMNLCSTCYSIEPSVIDDWLSSNQNTTNQVVFPNDPDILIDWIESRNWHDPSTLCEQLWQQVSYPATVTSDFFS